jgi:uncharacterized protein (DUF488 family)
LNALRVYSLGYEGLSLERYCDVLKANNVIVVVDVRETPWSYKRGFSKKPLSEGLKAQGITYVHIKSAGNPSKNRKQGFAPEVVLELYKEHLDAHPDCLEEIYDLIVMTNGAVCLLCFEQRPNECHRTVILDRIARQTNNLISCHLNGHWHTSEQPIASKWIPKPDDCERSRVHMEISEDESRFVPV